MKITGLGHTSLSPKWGY